MSGSSSGWWGSSSPLRGVATRLPRCCPGWRGSSSPLRGVATPRSRRRRAGRRCPVLIAPTRGRNVGGRVQTAACSCSPHRPYEGSQPAAVDGALGEVPRPHRPYEGSQLPDVDPGAAAPGARPHRPYEGSQRGNVRVLRRALRSSSPLRGVATPRSGAGSPRCAQVLIAPTRGRNRYIIPGCFCFHSPHRPYEGSQPPGCPACAVEAAVLIAPTRGRNVPARWESS